MLGSKLIFTVYKVRLVLQGDNRVYYQDNSTTVHALKLINNNSDLRDIYYLYCPGTVNGELTI